MAVSSPSRTERHSCHPAMASSADRDDEQQNVPTSPAQPGAFGVGGHGGGEASPPTALEAQPGDLDAGAGHSVGRSRGQPVHVVEDLLLVGRRARRPERRGPSVSTITSSSTPTMRTQPRAARSNNVATAASGVTTNPLVSRLATAGVSGPISDDSSPATTRGGRSSRLPTIRYNAAAQRQHGGQHQRAGHRFGEERDERHAGGHGRHLGTGHWYPRSAHDRRTLAQRHPSGVQDRSRRRRLRRTHHRRRASPTSATAWCAPTSTRTRVAALRRGEIPIVEEGLAEIVAVDAGQRHA